MWFSEHLYSEQPAFKLLEALGYTYLDGEEQPERAEVNTVILEGRLRAALARLNPQLSADNLEKAYHRMTHLPGDSLMERNQNAWKLLCGEATLREVVAGREEYLTVHYVDFENPEHNDWVVQNQGEYAGEGQNSIPDLVVYLNGLPVAVMECKSPSAENAWDEAYTDLRYYQENSPRLFHYNVLCVGLWKDGGRYGAIDAPQHTFSHYRAQPEAALKALYTNPTAQDVLLWALFRKDRLLDLLRYFVLYQTEEGTTRKKLPRYPQWRATNRAVARLQTDEGGVIWHTQGSGKSITMAYLTRKLRAQAYGFANPTILLMTDRKDLDQQLFTTFTQLGFEGLQRANSVQHLQQMLANDYGGVMFTTIQKFQEVRPIQAADPDATGEPDEDQTTLEELGETRIKREVEGQTLIKITEVQKDGAWEVYQREEIPLTPLSEKKNLFVLVDEAHRSQYGFLAAFMRSVLPHAKFVAFTGTPLVKEERNTLREFFGDDYIDTYTLRDSVADGATLPLFYDEVQAKLEVQAQALDEAFLAQFGEEPEEKQEELKARALKAFHHSEERIAQVARHLVQHYQEKIYPDGHKAMIVCDGQHMAVAYKKALEALKQAGVHTFESKVILSVGSPKQNRIAQELYAAREWNKAHPAQPKPEWVVLPGEVKEVTESFKLPFGDASVTERSGRKKYDNTAFLIVSDMLLTGYDAPLAACLYLDKPLKEHTLLQALARVNRTRKGKHAGYILDYYGNGEHLIQALEMYGGELKREDVLRDLNEELPRLDLHLERLVSFFRPLRRHRREERDEYVDEAVRFLEPRDRRDTFKVLLRQFNVALNRVLPKKEAYEYQRDFKLYNEIKLRARNAYREDSALQVSQAESRKLEALLQAHLRVIEMESLLDGPLDITDPGFDETLRGDTPHTRELKLRQGLIHIIEVGLDRNPDFFRPLSEQLEELLRQKEQDRIHTQDLVKTYLSMRDQIVEEKRTGEAKGFDTEGKRAVLETLKEHVGEEAEAVSQQLFENIAPELGLVDWNKKEQIIKIIETKIRKILRNYISREEARRQAVILLSHLRKDYHA